MRAGASTASLTALKRRRRLGAGLSWRPCLSFSRWLSLNDTRKTVDPRRELCFPPGNSFFYVSAQSPVEACLRRRLAGSCSLFHKCRQCQAPKGSASGGIRPGLATLKRRVRQHTAWGFAVMPYARPAFTQSSGLCLASSAGALALVPRPSVPHQSFRHRLRRRRLPEVRIYHTRSPRRRGSLELTANLECRAAAAAGLTQSPFGLPGLRAARTSNLEGLKSYEVI